ncbi:hypothetical protein [Streptomyces niphimycinicus]|nr:hypothetical protein [Streptomyces niphimycinicus]
MRYGTTAVAQPPAELFKRGLQTHGRTDLELASALRDLKAVD